MMSQSLVMSACPAKRMRHTSCTPLPAVMLSHNHDDFELLHELVLFVGGHHPGILIVRRDNDAKRDMVPKTVARALRKLLVSGLAIDDELYVLNHWR